MANAPLRQCPRCRKPMRGKCQACVRETDQRRGTATERGYNSQWEREREAYLSEHPLCEQCLAGGLECWKLQWNEAMGGALLDFDTNEPIADAMSYDARTRTLTRSDGQQEVRRCVYEAADAVYREAKVVDHIVPHRGDARLFSDQSNRQGLCVHHHSRKTARGE